MFEKVNPAHPDKIADRIAGAIVDEAYRLQECPKIAVEVLIGHGEAKIIAETSVRISPATIDAIVQRIAGVPIKVDALQVPQDARLAKNLKGAFRCGDNGIFRGCVVTDEQRRLTDLANVLYKEFPTDGKFILDEDAGRLVICQSHCPRVCRLPEIDTICDEIIINPLGEWTGGIDVDSGATNGKLGSDMGDAVTGGGLHGKDLTKADVSVNIFLHLLAQENRTVYEAYCSIGDMNVMIKRADDTEYDPVFFADVVEEAREYIDKLGGFEKFAEWGLIR